MSYDLQSTSHPLGRPVPVAKRSKTLASVHVAWKKAFSRKLITLSQPMSVLHTIWAGSAILRSAPHPGHPALVCHSAERLAERQETGASTAKMHWEQCPLQSTVARKPARKKSRVQLTSANTVSVTDHACAVMTEAARSPHPRLIFFLYEYFGVVKI